LFFEEGSEMKLLIGAAALILLFSGAAGAQNFGSNVGGGGSLNAGTTLNSQGSLGGMSFHSMPSNPEPFLHMTVTNGSDSEFIPSTFVSFAQAVEIGRMMRAAKPKSLAEVALEYRNEKKAKPQTSSRPVTDIQGTGRED
jgi:hypothetical protein